MLPRNSILGELTITQIYQFYNIPVLFACRNRVGHVFLAVLIDQNDEQATWLYSPLSEKRFTLLKENRIDLHDAFAGTEDCILLVVTVPFDPDQAPAIELRQSTDVDPKWLPKPNHFLNLPFSLPRVVWNGVDQRSLDSDFLVEKGFATTQPITYETAENAQWKALVLGLALKGSSQVSAIRASSYPRAAVERRTC